MPSFRAAAIQFEPRRGAVEENVNRMVALCEVAACEGCQLMVLPEMATSGYVFGSREEIAPFVEPIPGPSTDRLTQLAAAHGCWIVLGLPEVDLETGAFYNSAAVVGPPGVLGRVRKVHLYPADTRWARSGTLGFPVWETPLGRIGCLICMDACYPEPARLMALQGAEVLCFPTNWVDERAPGSDWFTRAFENRVYWIAADRYGEEEGVQFSGGSCVIGPDGRLLGVRDGGDGIVACEIALPPAEEAYGTAEGIPSRRPELYQTLLLSPPWSLERFPRHFCHPRALAEGGVATVAVWQMGRPAPTPDEARSRAEERIAGLVSQLGPSVVLIVLPELAFVADWERAAEWAEPIPGPTTEWATRLCRRLGAYLVFGLPERDGATRYNDAVLCGPEGILARYRRVHLSRRDEAWAMPGEQGPVVCDLPLGRVGLLVGSEALLPEWVRVLALQGADLVCAPSAVSGPRPTDLPPTRLPLPQEVRAIPDQAYWHLWRARAAENNLYLAFANRGEAPFMGWSGVFGPQLIPRYEAHIQGQGDGVAWLNIDTRDFSSGRPNPVRYKELIRSRQAHAYEALVLPGLDKGAEVAMARKKHV
jgi:predicted amidohydrolase